MVLGRIIVFADKGLADEPAHTGPDTYDTDEACTMDIVITSQ
jgi:hypothetical protein